MRKLILTVTTILILIVTEILVVSGRHRFPTGELLNGGAGRSLIAGRNHFEPHLGATHSLRSFVHRVGKANVEALAGLYSEIEMLPEEKRPPAYQLLANKWLLLDPKGALKFGIELAEVEKGKFVALVIDNWPGHLIDEAFDLLSESGIYARKFLPELFVRACSFDPKVAASYFDQLEDGWAKDNALKILVQRWGASAPSDAIAWIRQNINEANHNGLLLEIAKSNFEINEEIALAILAEMEAGAEREELVRELSSSKLEENLETGLEWIMSLNDGDQMLALLSIPKNWVDLDPAGAVAFGSDLADPEIKMKFLTDVAMHWGAKEPKEALKWLGKDPEIDTGGELALALFNSWGERDPKEASQNISSLKGGASRKRAATTISRAFATTNIEQAKQLVTDLENGDAAQGAVGGLVDVWARKDMEGAAAWINEMPAGKVKDRGVIGIAWVEFKKNPEGGISMLMGLDDSEMKSHYIQRFGREWIRSEGDIAIKALSKLDFTPEEKLILGIGESEE